MPNGNRFSKCAVALALALAIILGMLMLWQIYWKNANRRYYHARYQAFTLSLVFHEYYIGHADFPKLPILKNNYGFTEDDNPNLPANLIYKHSRPDEEFCIVTPAGIMESQMEQLWFILQYEDSKAFVCLGPGHVLHAQVHTMPQDRFDAHVFVGDVTTWAFLGAR